MSSLQKEMLVSVPNIELGICFNVNGEPSKVLQEGVTYYPVPHHIKSKTDKILDLIKYNDVTRDEVLWPYYIEIFKKVIEDFKPDVIEVFGSELYIGLGVLAAEELKVPCILHLQGILSLYIHIFLPIGVSTHSYYISRGFKSIYPNFQYLTYWKRSCHRERTILRATSHVIGRTDWDRNALEVLNPQAKYHYGGEILRPCFYNNYNRIIPNRPVIVTTSSGATYKGFDLILKIANLLTNEIGVDFEWKVYGNVDPSFFEKFTGIHHEDVNVSLCGVATAEQLCEAITHCTVYVQSSYIENSPNSIAESQILSVPAVATNVGGTDSMVEHGKTGLLFPATDPYIGAHYIAKLINDIELNISMGKEAQHIARQRHDRKTIVKQLLDTYTELLE